MLSRIVGKVMEIAVVVVLTICALQYLTNGALLDATDHFPDPPKDCTDGAVIDGEPDVFFAGDANGDGVLNIPDGLWVLNYLFTAGWPLPAEVCAGTDLPWTPEEVDEITALIDSLEIVDVEEGDETYTTVRFSGVNVQIVNGLDATNGNPDDAYTTVTADTEVNGLGNLIIGYNVVRTDAIGADPASDPELGDDPVENTRTGSHNLVIGDRHNYSSFAGIVAGRTGEITAPFATVTGGYTNVASAVCASVVGGCSNTASANFANVTGGRSNVASGFFSHVSGGGGPPPEDVGNEAAAFYSCIVGGESNSVTLAATRAIVVGGLNNTAGSLNSAILAGADNTTEGGQAAVSGGQWNVASGDWSVVAGGGAGAEVDGNVASSTHSMVSGGCTNAATAPFSSVNGGRHNIASGDWSSILGGGGTTDVEGNEASGDHSTVAGGASHTASGDKSAVSGGEWNLASGDYATVAGGGAGEEIDGNEAEGVHSVVSGGCSNTSVAVFSSVTGGQNNIATGAWSTIVGGGSGIAIDGNITEESAVYSVIVGGLGNAITADADNGVILGGVGNSLEDADGCLGCDAP